MRYAVRKREHRWVVSSGTQCGLEFDELREALAVVQAALAILQQACRGQQERRVHSGGPQEAVTA